MKRAMVRLLAVAMASLVALQPTLASAGVASSWLEHLNSVRAVGGLPPVAEDATLSDGCQKHARYMSVNRVITHFELPELSYYTPEGDRAARRSNLVLGATDVTAIDLWAAGPFHAVGMLDPGLTRVGFGGYDVTGYWRSAALDISSGVGAPVAGTVFPVMWPGPGAVATLLAYEDDEYPDPLAGTGFTQPAGAPIIAQFGAGTGVPNVTGSSLRSGGVGLEHAVYSETTYRNSDAAQQSRGRAVLNSRDAVVIMPKRPLAAGTRYDVSLEVNGRVHAWSFTTPGQTNLSLAAPRVTAYGARVAASATLTGQDGTPLDGRTVTFETSSDGRTWASAATTLTAADGVARFDCAPQRRLFIRASFAGDASAPARESAPVAVLPRAKLGTPATTTATRLGSTVAATGTLLPKHSAGTASVRVEAQRYEAGRWVTRARFNGYTSSTGLSYRSAVRLPYRGTWRLRAVHLQDTYNSTGVSSWRTVSVR